MNLLALDTSTNAAAVGIKAGAVEAVKVTVDVPRQHGRDLAPLLREALKRASLRPIELDVVAVGLGPGSFTGLRIGLAAAKTLAYVSGAVIIGIDSLEAIAANAPPEALIVSVVADAQRGDLYTADFTRVAPWGTLTRMTATRIESFSDWSARIIPGTFVLGPGLDSRRDRQALPEGIVVGIPSINRPDAARMIDLGLVAWEHGRHDDLWTIEPRYLRRSAAEEQWDVRPPSGPSPRNLPQPSTDRQQTT